MSIGLLGDDVVEFVEVEIFVGFGVVDDVSIVHHFDYFIIIQCFSKFFGDSLKTVEINHTLSFIIPELKDF